ncbi:protein yipf1 like protein [Quercus suber]|uniref:Protein YIP n=1 Tax=Quercus suber TaxID=58331 RepID=A0AAW0ISU3_QUESU
MDESYTSLPTSHLLGSVPAVIKDEKSTSNYEVPEANLQIFPPTNGGGGGGGRGYQTLGSAAEGFEQQPANGWRGMFNILSYTQYFDVDTDVVVNRLISSLHPIAGDFFSKIDANPDLTIGFNYNDLSGTSIGFILDLWLHGSIIILLEGFEQQPANGWRGMFNILSYTQYFDVDTDVVVNRLISSLHPIAGDFFSKIDANPDLYGLIWISTTLVFVLASFGNCATYLMEKHTDSTTSWNFDVSYINVAAGSVYGYAIGVPLAFYFLLQYLGSKPSLVQFWCLWGYSFFVFVLAAFLLLIPVEILRWMIIILAGATSACFVAFNLKSHVEGRADLSLTVVAAFLLQMALAIFIKVWFFP